MPIGKPSPYGGQGCAWRQLLGGDPIGSRLTLALYSMSIGSALNAAGVMAATIGTITSLTGLLGVVVTTPTFCPRHPVDAAQCRNAATKAAGLATQGIITAGVAGLMIAGARAIDPEA